MSKLLYFATNAALALLGLITFYLLVMAMLALFAALPKNMNSTFELPIRLQNMENFYLVKDLNPEFKSTHIEVKKANLEILPENNTWPQTVAYLHTAIFLGFFIGILYLLSKLLFTFVNNRPFTKINALYIRWIGILTIGLALYQFIIQLSVVSVFGSKFIIENASILDTPGIWDIDLITLFLGLVFIALSSVFKTGVQLQELEDQTV